nr:hypothetical protein [uncultured Albidiferax sp.]
MTLYTLKKHKETEEQHLFEATLSADKKSCTSKTKSICEKMANSDGGGNAFICQTEDQARTKCAALGRMVCGVCVSSLYATYP